MELYVNKDSLSCQFFVTDTPGPRQLYSNSQRPPGSLCTTAEMCSGGWATGQGLSSWFKGMTWEWSRDVVTPSSSPPSSLLSQLLPMCACSGEGVEGLSPALTVFSEGRFQVRGPPLSLTFRQSAKDVGCPLAQGGHDTGC